MLPEGSSPKLCPGPRLLTIFHLYHPLLPLEGVKIWASKNNRVKRAFRQRRQCVTETWSRGTGGGYAWINKLWEKGAVGMAEMKQNKKPGARAELGPDPTATQRGQRWVVVFLLRSKLLPVCQTDMWLPKGKNHRPSSFYCNPSLTQHLVLCQGWALIFHKEKGTHKQYWDNIAKLPGL